MEVLAFKYNTEEEAQNAINQLNSYYGIPIAEGYGTQTWTKYKQENDFFYILSNESISEVLGTPITINLDLDL